MKLYRDMNEQERRVSDQILSFSMEMQKIQAEARMAIWDNLTAEERKKYLEETDVCG
jgi:ribonucleotide reductase beta subunit family protein with ferritin-like domain